MRLESIEAVNKILEEANKRIQPTGTGMLWVSQLHWTNWGSSILLIGVSILIMCVIDCQESYLVLLGAGYMIATKIWLWQL